MSKHIQQIIHLIFLRVDISITINLPLYRLGETFSSNLMITLLTSKK